MSAVLDRASFEGAPAASRSGRTWPAVLGVVAVAAALRLFHLQSAYELFIDEITYADLSANVAAGRGVGLNGRPFDLHPPLLFLIFAGVLGMLGTDLDDPFALVEALRPVEAVTGALTCGLLVLLVARVAHRSVAILAGLLLALDPFVIRFDSRVLLEAPAMVLTVAGLLLVTRVLTDVRRPLCAALLAGLVLGLAVLVKETFAFIAVLPLLVTAFTVPRYRRPLLMTAATTTGAYVAYLVVLALVGRSGHWAEQKLSGVRRLLGLDQITGFNRAGSTSFSARVVELLDTFAVTYAIIGVATVLAVVAAVAHVLAWRRDAEPSPRPVAVLVIATQLSAAAYLVYAVGLGTLEEQAFYLVVAPSVAVLALGANHAIERGAHAVRSSRHSVTAVVLVVVAGLAVVTADVSAWWRTHTVADDGYRRYVVWVADNLGPTDRLAVTDDNAQFITPGVVLGGWSTPAEIRANDADYVLVAQALVDKGLGKADETLVSWLDENGSVVLDVRTPSLESLRVYRVGP